MSLAENLLKSLVENDYKNSRMAGIEPQEEHIIVGQDRVITVPNSLKNIAVTGDKNVETVTFDCVRYWDGIDLTTFEIYLNYTLPDGKESTHVPNDIVIFDDHYSFTWTIGNSVTENDGNIQISVMARLIDDNGVLQKQWSSFTNSELTIVKGLHISYFEGEDKEEQDVLSQLMREINNKVSKDSIVQQEGNAKDKVMSQDAVTKLLSSSGVAVVGAVLEKVSDDTQTIISFKIDGVTYQASSNMTWEDWCDSSYNKIGLHILGNDVMSTNNKPLIFAGVKVVKKDIVLSNASYTLVQVSEPDTPETPDTPTIIYFSINDKTYRAESGMTFKQWINSPYNTDGYRENGDIVSPQNSDAYLELYGLTVKPDDGIVKNGVYTYEVFEEPDIPEDPESPFNPDAPVNKIFTVVQPSDKDFYVSGVHEFLIDEDLPRQLIKMLFVFDWSDGSGKSYEGMSFIDDVNNKVTPLAIEDSYTGSVDKTLPDNFTMVFEGSVRVSHMLWSLLQNYEVTEEPDIPDIISFTIDGTPYQAESGMLWNEWVEREYNTHNFEILDGYILVSENKILQLNGVNVTSHDPIEPNGVYKSVGYNIGGLKSFTISTDIGADIANAANGQYNFVDGMTWGEWVESEYNTCGLILTEDSGKKVIQHDVDTSVALQSLDGGGYTYTYDDDLIVANHTYDFTPW